MRQRSLSPQKPSTASQQGAWYVTLKKGNCAKTQTKVFTPGGKYADPFPIVFKVPTEDLAHEVLSYRDAINVIQGASTVVDRVRTVYTLSLGDNILEDYIAQSPGHGLYPVVYGAECAVFLTYDDAVNATKGVAKPIWKKVPCFKRVVAYMVSRGESEKSTNLELKMLLDTYLASDRAAREAQGPNTDTPPTPQRLPASFSQMTPTQARTAHRRDARGTPSARAASSDLPPPSPPSSPSPPPSPSLSASDPLLSKRTFDISTAELNPPSDLVYQHTRDLRGIKRTHGFPVINTTKVPSCGASLDMFLQALGYDIESKLIVAYACRNSNVMEAFVKEMLTHGLPALEAKYMWYLWQSDLPTQEWADTLIM